MATISVVQAPELMVKTFNPDGSKSTNGRLYDFNIKSFTANNPQQLKSIFEQLQSNECIISGQVNDGTLTKLHSAKRKHFSTSQQEYWFPFDRDYFIKDIQTIDALKLLDPQFNYISYLRKSSNSNIIINNKPQAPHREKIWVLFKGSHEQISQYINNLQKKAFLLGLAKLQLSPNEDSTAIHTVSVFDSSCFRPEAQHYEALPVINNSNIKHNTFYEIHDGQQHYLDPTKFKFPEVDNIRYKRLRAQLKEELKPAYKKRLEQAKKLKPEQDWFSLNSGFLSDDAVLYTTDGTQHKVGNILTQLILGNDIKHYLDTEYTDPLDPSYHGSTQKAKLYLNEDNTLILHSFAHGSHYYRVAADLTLIPEVLDQLDFPLPKTKDYTKSRPILQELKRILPYFYAKEKNDILFVASLLSKIASQKHIENLIKDYAYNPFKSLPEDEHPMKEYVFLKKGDGRAITLDPEDGLIGMSMTGAVTMCANKHKNFTGAELVDMWKEDESRQDVTGFGLYPLGTKSRLPLWADFQAVELGKRVTQEDIEPFIYHLKLASGDDEEGLAYLLNWVADLVQFPLREGARPAIVLKSEIQGTGKSTLYTLLQSFFYEYNVFEAANLDKLVGKHNAHLASTVLFGLHEVVAPSTIAQNNARHFITDSLKNIITEDRLSVEPKGIDADNVPNKIHLLITTNKDFIYFDSQNRRFTVFDFSTKHQQDIPYFSRLRKWWFEENGRDLTFTYFKQYKVNKDLAQLNYKNDSTIAASVKQLWGTKGELKWLFYFIADLPEEEKKYTADELHTSYLGAYVDYKGTDTGAFTKRELTSFLKNSLGSTPALEYKSNKYIIRKSIAQEKFATKYLSGVTVNWKDYELVSSQEIPLVPADEQTNDDIKM